MLSIVVREDFVITTLWIAVQGLDDGGGSLSRWRGDDSIKVPLDKSDSRYGLGATVKGDSEYKMHENNTM